MKAPRPPYAARKHPEPTRQRRWAVVDTRDGSVVSHHYFRKNAVATAGLTNSIAREYGTLTQEADNA